MNPSHLILISFSCHSVALNTWLILFSLPSCSSRHAIRGSFLLILSLTHSLTLHQSLCSCTPPDSHSHLWGRMPDLQIHMLLLYEGKVSVMCWRVKIGGRILIVKWCCWWEMMSSGCHDAGCSNRCKGFDRWIRACIPSLSRTTMAQVNSVCVCVKTSNVTGLGNHFRIGANLLSILRSLLSH